MTESVSDVSSQGGNISNSNEAIKVIQINAQHAQQAQLNINHWIDKQKQTKYIVLVQEPYIYKKKAAMQPHTAQKYTGGNNKSPRTSIYTHPNLPVWYLDHIEP